MEIARILLVEDDADTAEMVTTELQQNGYEVRVLRSGNGCVEEALAFRPHLILIDLKLPDIDGRDVCRMLCAHPALEETFIVIFSGRATDSDVVGTLDIGADDFIPKSTSPEVFLAKLRAALRRRLPSPSRTAILEAGPLVLDRQKRELRVAGSAVSATYSEARLAELLLMHPSRIFSRSEIVEFVRGRHYHVTERSVDVLVVNLRKKLSDYAHLVETIRGRGYRLKLD